MSLWSKPVESITFDDVNNFLLLKEREGPRLDYKADVPRDLAKLAAAFANTSGGLIVLGVDADKKTNEPKWPRSAGDPGMKSAKGIEERIHQICRDNIFPPVRPQVSPPLDVPGHPDHVLVVVRIDMSPEAPHATDGGRLIDVQFYRMYRELVSGDRRPDNDHVLRGARFPDATFRADRSTTPAELARDTTVMDDLLAQVLDGFDLPRLPSRAH